MNKLVSFMLTAAAITLAVTATAAADHKAKRKYDIVIKNGRVVSADHRGHSLDHTGLNIGIRNGKIRALTTANIRGRRAIDAQGLVVSPGFVDIHQHGLHKGWVQNQKLLDGVTTMGDFEGGALDRDHHQIAYKRLGLTINVAETVGTWYVIGLINSGLTPIYNDYSTLFTGFTGFKAILDGAPVVHWDQPIDFDDPLNVSLSGIFTPSIQQATADYEQCFNSGAALGALLDYFGGQHPTFDGQGILRDAPEKSTDPEFLTEKEALFLKFVEWELQNGAPGIGFLGYNAFFSVKDWDPASPPENPELTTVVKRLFDLAKLYGVPVYAHTSPLSGGPLGRKAFPAFFKYATANGVRMSMEHVVSSQNEASQASIDDMERAIAEGSPIGYNMYPWDAAATLAAGLSDADANANPQNYVHSPHTLADTGENVVAASLAQAAQASLNAVNDADPANDALSNCAAGDTLSDCVSKEWEAWQATGFSVIARAFNSQENLDYCFLGGAQENTHHCHVISDGISESTGAGHPRRFQSFARFVRIYVRGEREPAEMSRFACVDPDSYDAVTKSCGAGGIATLDLVDAVRRMTTEPLRLVRHVSRDFRERGVIALGKYADIVIWDPDTFSDPQDPFLNPQLSPSGMHYVIVNGELVLDDGQLITDATPGKVLDGRRRRGKTLPPGRERICLNPAKVIVCSTPPASIFRSERCDGADL